MGNSDARIADVYLDAPGTCFSRRGPGKRNLDAKLSGKSKTMLLAYIPTRLRWYFDTFCVNKGSTINYETPCNFILNTCFPQAHSVVQAV